MKVLGRVKLERFWKRHRTVEKHLRAWLTEVSVAGWNTPDDLLVSYPRARVLDGVRVLFNIKGNHYRLLTDIDYPQRTVLIQFVGTHAQYDDIDAKTYGRAKH